MPTLRIRSNGTVVEYQIYLEDILRPCQVEMYSPSEVARKMKEMGDVVEKIQMVTGLSPEAIEKLSSNREQ